MVLTPEQIKKISERRGDTTNITPSVDRASELQNAWGITPTQQEQNFEGVIKQPDGTYKPDIAGAVGKGLVESGGTVVKSGLGVLSGIINTVLHPIKTVQTLSNIAGGIVQGNMAEISDEQWKKYQEVNKFSDEEIAQQREQAQTNSVALQSATTMLKDRYGSLENIGKTITTDPVGFLLDFATLLEGGGSLLSKAGQVSKISKVSEAGKVISEVGKVANPIRQVASVVSKAGEALGVPKLVKGVYNRIGKQKDVKDIYGRIAQEKNAYKVGQVKNAFESAGIKPENVKTFKDASNVLQNSIKKDKLRVDKLYEQYPETFKPTDLKKTVIGEGGSKASINYVNEAISDLKNLYKNSPEELVKIKDLELKFKKEGLTSGEINNLSRKYGTEFGDKAFNKKTGEPLTSRSAQDYENVRKGLKENARGITQDNTIKNIEETMGDKIETTKIMDKLSDRTQTAINKLKTPKWGSKVGATVARVIDFLSQGSVKGFLKQMGLGMPQAKYADIIELQSELQKNLSLIEQINNAKPTELVNLMNNEKFVKSLLGLYYSEITSQDQDQE